MVTKKRKHRIDGNVSAMRMRQLPINSDCKMRTFMQATRYHHAAIHNSGQGIAAVAPFLSNTEVNMSESVTEGCKNYEHRIALKQGIKKRFFGT